MAATFTGQSANYGGLKTISPTGTAGSGGGAHHVTSALGSAAAVTPSDTVDLPNSALALMVSAAGDVKVDFASGGTGITLVGLTTGTIYPLQIKRVYATGTTATGIIALF